MSAATAAPLWKSVSGEFRHSRQFGVVSGLIGAGCVTASAGDEEAEIASDGLVRHQLSLSLCGLRRKR